MSEDRKMLEPMATVVSTVLRLVLALTVVGVVYRALRGSWGSAFICVEDDSTGMGTFEVSDFPSLEPARGVDVTATPSYCVDDPGLGLNLLDQLGQQPTTLLLISCLFLLHQLLRGAARDGVHTLRTAARLRLLGWWLLAGSLVVGIVEANAKVAVLAQLSDNSELDFTAASWLTVWSPPYLAILTGLGLLTFARITAAGASMREDLEGVV